MFETSKYSISSFFFIFAICFILAQFVGQEYYGTLCFYILFVIFEVFLVYYLFPRIKQNSLGIQSSFVIFLIVIPMFFILGLRNASGIDDSSYMFYFSRIIKADGVIKYFLVSTLEPGYILLNKLCSYISKDYLFLQAVCSLISLSLFVYGFALNQERINSVIAILYLLCFLFFQMLSVALVRMFIAMSLVACALYFLFEKRTKEYIFLIIIATLFHYSAAALLPLFILTKDRYSLEINPKLVIIGLTIAMFSLIFVIEYFSGEFLSVRHQRFTAGASQSLRLSFGQFDTLPFLIFGLWMRQYTPRDEHYYYDICLLMVYMSILISIISSVIPLDRMIYYYNLSLIFLFSSWVKNFPSNKGGMVVLLNFVLEFYCVLYLVKCQMSHVSHIATLFPYRNIFFTI